MSMRAGNGGNACEISVRTAKQSENTSRGKLFANSALSRKLL
jgi:hypothetical protein